MWEIYKCGKMAGAGKRRCGKIAGMGKSRYGKNVNIQKWQIWISAGKLWFYYILFSRYYCFFLKKFILFFKFTLLQKLLILF
jgi:hypothetical protein